MKKNLIIAFFTCISLILFNGCQGDSEYENEDQCIMAITFEVLKTPCPEAVATFDFVFYDKSGNQYEFPFELPSNDDAHLISLPSGNTYSGWVVGDGGLSFTCAGPFLFKINVFHPETGELCADMITYVDGRPDVIDESNPYISFTLPETCDGCPEIIEPEDACIQSYCGGYYDGFYGTYGYYVYPEEQLYFCPNQCVRVFGNPFGVPNRYTLKGDGIIINSQWVGDGFTYTEGPWSGTTMPLTYNYLFETQPEVEYTLQIETVVPIGLTDTWSCSFDCDTCSF